MSEVEGLTQSKLLINKKGRIVRIIVHQSPFPVLAISLPMIFHINKFKDFNNEIQPLNNI